MNSLRYSQTCSETERPNRLSILKNIITCCVILAKNSEVMFYYGDKIVQNTKI